MTTPYVPAKPETFSEQPPNLLRMNSRIKKSCGFVGWDGDQLYIELYDFSEHAHRCFDNDVSTMYRIAPKYLPTITQQLTERIGSAAEPTDLPEHLVKEFSDIESLLEWVTESGVEYRKTFDAWA